jgi:hypothetical protein
MALRLWYLSRISHGPRGRTGESQVQFRLLQSKLVLIGSELFLRVHLAIVLLDQRLLLPISWGYVAIHMLDLGPLHPLGQAGLL